MATLHEQVEEAIATVLTEGQSYRIMDREYTFADLDKLRAMRRELKSEARADSGMFQPVRFVSQ